jgi:hypothetical protein
METSEDLSVPQAVEVIIKRNYVVYEALRLDVVNYHALAAWISPKVTELTGTKPKLTTLVVAIKRFSDRLSGDRSEQLEELLKDAKVTLTGGMAKVTLEPKGTSPALVLQELAKTIPKPSTPPVIMMLADSVKLLVEREDGRSIKAEMGSRYPIRTEEEMAKIEVRLSQSAEKMRGIATFITELFYRNGVYLQVAYIGRPEIVLVVEERFAARAYDLLREVMTHAEP